MKAFAELYAALDQTTRTNAKVDALKRYLAAAQPEDAAWAVNFLIGRRPKRLLESRKLAQWAVESGWGKHQSGVNNYFGVKATAAQIEARHATQRLTNEYFNGAMHQMEQWFANYDTLEEGFSAHASLLVTPHYKACQDALTPEAYCYALQTCGYATAPNYAAVLISVIKAADLTQYDQVMPAATPQEPAKPAAPVAVAGGTGGEGSKTMPSTTNTGALISDFLQFFQDIPFDQIAAAVASGGRNIPADVSAAEAIVASAVKHFFNGGTAATAAPVIHAAIAAS